MEYSISFREKKEKLKYRKIKKFKKDKLKGRDERYYETGRIKVILKSLELEILVASSKSGIN